MQYITEKAAGEMKQMALFWEHRRRSLVVICGR